jgi:hypothetical protein
MKENLDVGKNFYGRWWQIVDEEVLGFFDNDSDFTNQPTERIQDQQQ